MRWRILQPSCFRLAAPLGQQLAQSRKGELGLAGLKTRLLHSQPFVVDKAARAGEAAHLSALRAIGTQLEFEGLQAFHEPIIRLVYERWKLYPVQKTLCLSSYVYTGPSYQSIA